ncbi:MAG: radical SAM protein [Bacteroidota bacterium]
MPLGLLTLAATLQQDKNSVKVYEPKIRLLKNEDYKKAAIDILKTKPDLIGFSTWCISYPASILVAKELKSLAPEIPIVFGGPQASVVTQQTLEEFKFVDYVLSGEADLSFPLFIKQLIKRKPDFSVVPGLTYRNGLDNIQQNGLKEVVSDLDALPVPAYDLIPKQKSIKLDVGRGCPFQCTYCTTNDFFSKKYRVKSAGRIIDEMMLGYRTNNIKSFSFAHDMFTLNKKFVFELCDKLISTKEEKGIDFTWTCSARIDCITDKMLIALKKAGCQSIFFGIETGSEKIQKKIKKNLDVSRVYEVADLCRKINLKMHVSYILGFIEETKADVEKTLHSILKMALKGTFTQSSELSFLPGTPIFNMNKHELKFDGRFSNFSHNVCGQNELNLIIQFPEIFSSFYYLPVKTMNREEMTFITNFINKQLHFRNTLFILSDQIKSDLSDKNLLQLYKSEYAKIQNDKNNIPMVSYWIRLLKKYIMKNEENNIDSVIYDVFSYEAFTALLLTLFTSWHITYQDKSQKSVSGNFLIKPTPAWKILTTSYKLEKVLPSENNWEENKNRVRKGIYKYLLVAVSEIKCKRIKINSKEEFLLENLSELFFSDYVKKVKTVVTEKEALLWIKKMRRLGVVEILTV